uniref:Mating-type related minus 1 n=1 Tax=Pseudo-nitzschia multistriata TaxID=183589 RepID=A0A7T8JL32_9STRA|nr:mating-type related minus 1 [Pseudo-nitzschia multistriata]
MNTPCTPPTKYNKKAAVCISPEQMQESEEVLLYRSNDGKSQLRTCRKRAATVLTSDASTDGSGETFVTDDDGDSVSSGEAASSRKKNRTTRTVQRRKATTTENPSPMPTKLTQAQIHSKSYTFPYKLFDLMEHATGEGGSAGSVVSWLAGGTTFCVHDHARFAAEFLPTHFGHHNFRSFDRQLNFWGFEVLSPRHINNKSFGGKTWQHPFFQKDRRHLLGLVVRKTVSKSSPGGAKQNKRKPKGKPRQKQTVARTVSPVHTAPAGGRPGQAWDACPVGYDPRHHLLPLCPIEWLLEGDDGDDSVADGGAGVLPRTDLPVPSGSCSDDLDPAVALDLNTSLNTVTMDDSDMEEADLFLSIFEDHAEKKHNPHGSGGAEESDELFSFVFGSSVDTDTILHAMNNSVSV